MARLRVLLAALVLVTLVGGALHFAPAARAASIVVNTTADNFDVGAELFCETVRISDLPGGGDGKISLREAICAANNTAGADTITFDSSLNGGKITLVKPLPEITSNLTITGPGAANLTIDGDNELRIFAIRGPFAEGNGATVAISGLKLANATASLAPRGDVVDGGAILVSGSVNGFGLTAASVPQLTVTLTGLVVDGNSSSTLGGGLAIMNATNGPNPSSPPTVGGNVQVTVQDSTFSNNRTIDNGFGGGIGVANGLAGTIGVTVKNTTFSGNRAVTGGGIGIGSLGGAATVTVEGSTFDGNTACRGGGLGMDRGSATVSGSAFTNNTATPFTECPSVSGGAIYVLSSESDPALDLSGSTVGPGNTSAGAGEGWGNGGGITLEGGAGKLTATIKNTTITGNTALGGDGGGVYVSDNDNPNAVEVVDGGVRPAATNPNADDVRLINATIAGNALGELVASALPATRPQQITGEGANLYAHQWGAPQLTNTLLANPSGGDNCGLGGVAGTPTIVNVSHNLDDGASCGFTTANGSKSNANPQLGALALNAPGTTRTLALGIGSAAVDAGDTTTACPATDQRGVTRPQGAACDIGAYELRFYALTIATAGGGTGTATPSPAPGVAPDRYAEGTVVSVTAAPTGGSTFGGWTLDSVAQGTGNPLSVTMNGAHAVVATFSAPNPSPSPASVTLTTTTTGSGTVTPAGATTHTRGTVVSVTATPASGFRFVGWVLDGTPADIAKVLQKDGWFNPNLTITMDASHTLNARFAPEVTFCDVTDATPYLSSIKEVAARGILRGYGNGCLGPGDTLIRAQLAGAIVRTFDWQNEPSVNPFADQGGIDDELWRAVGILANKGIAKGYGDNTFRPGAPVLYAQAVSIVTRAMEAAGYWTPQAAVPTLYGGVLNGSGHEADVATFVHYAGALPGTATDQPWTGAAGWNKEAKRQWLAALLYQALNAQFGVDRVP